MKRCFFAFLAMVLMWHGVSAQKPIYDSSRVYDIVTDTDDFYLFSMPKPCFNPCPYVWNPISRIVQEYVVTDTVTVYGVAIPLKNNTSNPIRDTISFYQALLMKKLGPFPGNNHGYSFENIDSVTLNRSHPLFCWFEYEDSCKHFLTAPCYEFYFDTPQQINRMTDTFYVGRYYCPPYVGYPDTRCMSTAGSTILRYQARFINLRKIWIYFIIVKATKTSGGVWRSLSSGLGAGLYNGII